MPDLCGVKDLSVSPKEEIRQLLSYLKELEPISSVSAYGVTDDLRLIKARLEDDMFRVAVVGEFSAGKSTFINALIGSDLLSHAVSETTASLTRLCPVAADDERNGRCEVEFRDGRLMILDSLLELRDYTTVQSDVNVAEEVKSVTVYAHFMDAEHPLIITDTPGLNGLADKHREITLEEVKTSHACIYLLPLRGVSDSDLEFLRTLSKYQSHFIFVQNFMDSLHESEQETPEAILEADRRAIDSVLSGDGLSQYQICAISALQALGAKDYAISRLYDSDTKDLTEDDRTRLWKTSSFSRFLEILSGLTSGGEYLRATADSAKKALLSILDLILPDLQTQNEFREAMKRTDAKAIRMQNLEQMINRLEGQKADRLRRLSDFVKSRDLENRRALKEYVGEDLNSLYEKTVQTMDKDIRTYDDLERFERVHGKRPPQYYGDMIQRHLNSELAPRLYGYIQDNLFHLHEEALRQAQKYSGEIRVAGSIAFEADMKTVRFQSNDAGYVAEIDRMRRQAGELEDEARTLKERINNAEWQKNQAQSSLNQKRQELSRIHREEQSAKNRLGSKPAVRSYQERHTRTVTKWFLFIPYDGTETYYTTEYDDSAQRAWIRDMREIESRFRDKEERHERQVRSLESQLSSIQNQQRRDQRVYESAQSRAQDIRREIQQRQRIYEDTLRRRKQEFCDAQKSRLKETLRQSLSGGNGDSLTQLNGIIDRSSERNAPKIVRSAQQYFEKGFQKKLDDLRARVSENREKLDEQYRMDTEEIKVLERIRDAIKEGAVLHDAV